MEQTNLPRSDILSNTLAFSLLVHFAITYGDQLDMQIREWLNNNSMLATCVALVVLIGALGMVVLQLRGPSYEPIDVYYWDLETNEHFVRTSDTIPPVEAPSGGLGAWAHLYSCGACTPDEWFGYLEMFTEEAKRMQEEQDMLPEAEEDHLVRPLRSGNEQWVPYFSEQGMAIQDGVFAVDCGQPDTLPQQCLP